MIRILGRIARGGRDGVLASLVRGGVLPQRGTLTILTYHRIVPVDSSAAARIEPGMYVDPDTLDMHLAVLKSYFEPVALRDWIGLTDREKKAGRYLAVTIDDGWLDNYEHGYDVLSSHQMPTTIFLVVESVNQNLTFWTEDLADLYFDSAARKILAEHVFHCLVKPDSVRQLLARPPTAHGLSELISVLKRLSDSQICRLIRDIEHDATAVRHEPDSGRRQDFMSWQEVALMAQSGVVDFGSHSMNHRRLDHVEDPAELHAEIVESKMVLQKKLGSAFNNVFCYPNGNVSGEALELVKENYSAACTTIPGANRAAGDSYELRRMSIHQDVSNTPNAMLARLS